MLPNTLIEHEFALDTKLDEIDQISKELGSWLGGVGGTLQNWKLRLNPNNTGTNGKDCIG